MKQNTTKLLAINSSPKPHGTTAKFLKRFIESAREQGAVVTRIDLYAEDIPFFSGETEQVLELSPLQEKILAADGFVIATPTYWFNVPAVLKNFIDNLTLLEENGFLLEGKVVGFIVYSPEGGDVSVLQHLAVTFNQMGVVFPPYSMLFSRTPNNKQVTADIKDLAKRMVVQITAQKHLNIRWGNDRNTNDEVITLDVV